MLLYIIRHGAPDYQSDTLLESGWEQAEAVSSRLALSGLDEIHASPMGRAVQTAMPTAKKLGLNIIIEPWAYELGEESKTSYPDGKAKNIPALQTTVLHSPSNRSLTLEQAFDNVDGLRGSGFKERYHAISTGLDDMLASVGYCRNENGFYSANSPNYRHVALFCHGGMTRVLLSHMLHVPYQFFATTLQPHFTGITILHFSGRGEPVVSPELLCFGDCGHLFSEGNRPIHYLQKTSF